MKTRLSCPPTTISPAAAAIRFKIPPPRKDRGSPAGKKGESDKKEEGEGNKKRQRGKRKRKKKQEENAAVAAKDADGDIRKK